MIKTCEVALEMTRRMALWIHQQKHSTKDSVLGLGFVGLSFTLNNVAEPIMTEYNTAELHGVRSEHHPNRSNIF